MDDDFDDGDDPRDAGERRRAVLRNVAAYQDLCQKVARGGTQSLIFGMVMLGVGYLTFDPRNPFAPFTLIYLCLGALELSVGLLNKFRPSAEGVLLDGLVLFAFGASHLARQLLVWQGVMRGMISPISVAFGLFWVYQGYQHVLGYAALRRAFADRPTGAHLRWFNELLHDIRTADPESDPQSLDLPTRPRLKAKLLGDTAVFVLPDGEILVAAREHVEILREPAEESDRLPTGYLTVEGLDFGKFKLHDENWKNYAAWKAERR